MGNLDYAAAKQYILHRLEKELPPGLYYHGLSHTRDDVFPAVKRLARMEGIEGEALILLKTAALYHDSGYLVEYFRNEPDGARLAAESLPEFGYTSDHIEQIRGIIMATQLPQKPTTLLQEIICDADLDSLGRKDFFVISQRLRLELAEYGHPVPLRAWYHNQLQFLQEHRYFTASSRHLRRVTKQENISEIKSLLNGA